MSHLTCSLCLHSMCRKYDGVVKHCLLANSAVTQHKLGPVELDISMVVRWTEQVEVGAFARFTDSKCTGLPLSTKK